MCIVEILQNVGGGFMNLLFKLLLTINATSWFLIIYAVKEKISIFSIPCVIFHIVLILTVVFLSWISLLISKCFDKEILDSCAELSLADNEFLSVYLGYPHKISPTIRIASLRYLRNVLSHKGYPLRSIAFNTPSTLNSCGVM